MTLLRECDLVNAKKLDPVLSLEDGRQVIWKDVAGSPYERFPVALRGLQR